MLIIWVVDCSDFFTLCLFQSIFYTWHKKKLPRFYIFFTSAKPKKQTSTPPVLLLNCEFMYVFYVSCYMLHVIFFVKRSLVKRMPNGKKEKSHNIRIHVGAYTCRYIFHTFMIYIQKSSFWFFGVLKKTIIFFVHSFFCAYTCW